MAKREQRAAVTDADLRRATLEVLAHEGVDAATIPRIAVVAGVAPASVYRRYDSGPDAVFDVWQHDLRPCAQRAMRASLALARQPSSPDAAWLMDELRSPSDLMRSLMGVLAVARRLGPVGTDVIADTEADLDALILEHTELPGVMVLAHVLPLFGAWMLDPVSPGVAPAVADLLGSFAAEYANPKHWQESSVGNTFVAPAPFTAATGDVALDDLRSATFRVVARYGFAGATATRIAREAGRSLTSAYRRVGSKDELIADAVGSALSVDLGFTGAENASSLSFARPDRLRRAWQASMIQIDDRNRTNRAFVLELLNAVGTTPIIGATAKQWGASVQQRFRVAAQTLTPDRADALGKFWAYRMATGIGGLLFSFAAPRIIRRFDPAPIICANDTVTAHLMGSSTGDR